MANASYFGRGAPDDGAGLAPSFRAGCEGFTGAEELQRSEKESDIVIDSTGSAPGAVFGFVRLRVSAEDALQDLTLTLTHGPDRRSTAARLKAHPFWETLSVVDNAHETMLSSCLRPVATTAI